MRKHFILSLTLIMVLIAAVAAMAADKTEPKYHRTSGDIVSVDGTAGTFSITHGSKENWTFKTDGSTKVKGLGKDINLTDLKPGDNVRVSYTETASDKTAARIDVLHGKKSHA